MGFIFAVFFLGFILYQVYIVTPLKGKEVSQNQFNMFYGIIIVCAIGGIGVSIIVGIVWLIQESLWSVLAMIVGLILLLRWKFKK